LSVQILHSCPCGGDDSMADKTGEKKKNTVRVKKVALYGLLVALALVLSYVEAQVPAFFVMPGMKLGLTNVVVLIALTRMGYKDALVINILRIVIVGFTFSNTFSMLYSLAGGMLSWLAMSLLKRTGRFGLVGISVAGGVFHNLGQIIAAAMLVSIGSLLYYLPFLLVSGTAAGVMIGFISAMVVKRLPRDYSA